MRRPETTFGQQDSAGRHALYMAMELGDGQCALDFTDRRHRLRRVSVASRNLVAHQEQIGGAKAPPDIRVDAMELWQNNSDSAKDE
jgi:hypothetical protein